MRSASAVRAASLTLATGRIWLHSPAVAERFSLGSSLDIWLRDQADALCVGGQWLPLLSAALDKAAAFRVDE
ncbi:MAG: hypothetical protein ACKOPS_07405, partial [Cyanobium sp.]